VTNSSDALTEGKKWVEGGEKKEEEK